MIILLYLALGAIHVSKAHRDWLVTDNWDAHVLIVAVVYAAIGLVTWWLKRRR